MKGLKEIQTIKKKTKKHISEKYATYIWQLFKILNFDS